MTSVEEAVAVLNRLADKDRNAISRLCLHRVACNEKLADDETCQVGAVDGEFVVGLIGILNALFGCDESQIGYIRAIIDQETGTVLRFEASAPIAEGDTGDEAGG